MKKVISLLLVAALLTAALAVSFNAVSVSDVEDGVPVVQSVSEGIAAYEAENEMEPGSLKTQRIYFMMPNGKNGPVATDDVYVHYDDELDPDTGEVITPAHDELVLRKGDKSPSWYNDFNILDGKHYAGIYWWGGPAEKDGYWVGYRMDIEDYDQGIYYADVPYDVDDPSASVAVAIFNNGVDGGMDSTKPIYDKAAQTADTNVEGAFIGDYDSLEYGSPDPWSFNNCIYVVNPDRFSINKISRRQECGADWYVYYGNGCYGKEYQEGVGEDSEYPDGTPGWSDNVADMCMNPDHFKDGVHVGYQPPVDDPTEPAPTEAPTQAPPTEPAELLGDVDGDGTVTINDAVLIQRADVGIITATADMTRRGDVDGDGQLTIFDATFIQRFLADIPVSYKINQPILSSTPH